MTHDIIPDGRNLNAAERDFDGPLSIAPGSNVQKLLAALLVPNDQADADLEDLYDQRFVSTATGRELDRFGDLVGVRRKTNESDEKYRKRITAEFAQSTIETTFDEFAQFTASILGTDVANVEFDLSLEATPATILVRVDGSVVTQSPLTATETEDLLGGGVPAGHQVTLQQSGTFRVKVDGAADDPDKGLTSDSTSTGGTLAEDLV